MVASSYRTELSTTVLASGLSIFYLLPQGMVTPQAQLGSQKAQER